jgi:glyoxylase-like metal-dependent hydrolase (beta-lactamase superfamily II)
MHITTFPAGPLQCNCSIIACPETKQAAVIDPGGDVEEILRILQENGLTVKYLLHTHAHFDHILGSRQLKEKTGAQICLHKGDDWLYENLGMQCGLFGFKSDEPLPVDVHLNDDEELKIGNIKTRVIHTPGHTPGSLCFEMGTQDNLLYSGDTLFQQGIGRTDLWGGNFDDIVKSIKGKLFRLDDSTKVVPGHGPTTTIHQEKKLNPFVGA